MFTNGNVDKNMSI